MSKTLSEQALETAIVADLVKAHYVQRPPSAFEKALCLDPGPLIDFIQATQPKEWSKFVVQHKEDAKPAFLKLVAQAVEADGTVTLPGRTASSRQHLSSLEASVHSTSLPR